MAIREISVMGGELEKRLHEVLTRAETELDTSAFKDYQVCRCKLHKKVTCGVRGGQGCDARKHGNLQVLASLYDPKIRHGFCAAEPGVRQNDQLLVDRAMDLTNGRKAWSRGVDGDDEGLHMGMKTSDSDWGAGYCMMPAFCGGSWMRIGRILGPKPLLVDVLRMMRTSGRKEMAVYKLIKVDAGVHMVKDPGEKGQLLEGGRILVSRMLDAIDEYGTSLRIGAESMQARCYREYLQGLIGKEIRADAGIDFEVGSRTLATMPLELRGAKARRKSLEMIGDRAMKLALALVALNHNYTGEQIAGAETTTQSDKAFGAAAVGCGLMDYVSCGPGVDKSSARVGGDSMECAFGIVYLYCGLIDMITLAIRVEAWPEDLRDLDFGSYGGLGLRE